MKAKATNLAYLRNRDGKTYAVYPALKNREKLAGSKNPEELVRMAAYNELITKYKYPPELIDIEYPVLIREDEQPRFADIVVCTDKERKRPFIVVETKKPKKSEGEKQGQRYATILRAVYVLWTNGSDRAASVLVNRYPEDAATLKDIPIYGGAPKYSITKLEAFKDDRQITDAFRKCHDLIRNLSHLKPDDAFTEFLKVLLVKLQDESKGSDYEFQIYLRGQPPSPESANETAQRIRQIYKLAADQDGEIADVFRKEDDIALTNDCIAKIVQQLQRFSFGETAVDQKGRAFETFISSNLRQEFKEFMTPRPVIQAMVAMADPDRQTVVLDPCCGSAAFLVFALKHVAAKIAKQGLTTHQRIKATFDYAHDRLWGFDASKQMASVGRIAMIMNDDGRAHIFNHDALNPRALAPEPAKQRHFKLILTNPPFGKRINAPADILAHFVLAQDDKGRTITRGSLVTEVLFLERNLEWLEPEGRMFIVLPDSVLGNSTLAVARKYIDQLARIVGVLSLSPDTFGPSGAKSKTSVLILQKRVAKKTTADYDDENVFLAHAEHVGYDFTGRATGKDDLPGIVQEFLSFISTGKCGGANCKVIHRSKLGDTWLAQPHLSAKKKKSKSTSGTVTLGAICASISTGKTAPRNDYRTSGLHMIKVGNLTGRGIEWCSVERQFVDASFLQRYPNAQVQPGDILLTAAAHGPKWIGLKVDIFEGAPKGLDPRVLVCGEIMRLRLKSDAPVEPYYVLLYLRSAAGYTAIQKCIRGQSGHIYPDQVAEIAVPLPNGSPGTELEQALTALKSALTHRKAATDLDDSVHKLSAQLFPSSTKKPIIAMLFMIAERVMWLAVPDIGARYSMWIRGATL